MRQLSGRSGIRQPVEKRQGLPHSKTLARIPGTPGFFNGIFEIVAARIFHSRFISTGLQPGEPKQNEHPAVSTASPPCESR